MVEKCVPPPYLHLAQHPGSVTALTASRQSRLPRRLGTHLPGRRTRASPHLRRPPPGCAARCGSGWRSPAGTGLLPVSGPRAQVAAGQPAMRNLALVDSLSCLWAVPGVQAQTTGTARGRHATPGSGTTGVNVLACLVLSHDWTGYVAGWTGGLAAIWAMPRRGALCWFRTDRDTHTGRQPSAFA